MTELTVFPECGFRGDVLPNGNRACGLHNIKLRAPRGVGPHTCKGCCYRDPNGDVGRERKKVQLQTKLAARRTARGSANKRRVSKACKDCHQKK